jgi:DNA-binding GntR family transcriptional regulator
MTTDGGSKLFTPVAEKSLRDHVATNIRQAIEAGALKPGDRLVEAEIAAQMGISRAPVREAIRLLEQEGFVTSTPRKGTFVVKLERQDIEEIYSLRSVLESLAVKLALPRLTPLEINELESLVNDMRQAADARDTPRLVETDLAFHQRLVCLSGHNRLLQDWLRMSTQLRLFFAMKNQLYENPRDVAESHQPVLDALRARNLEAAQQALTEHIVEAGQLVLASLDAEP